MFFVPVSFVLTAAAMGLMLSLLFSYVGAVELALVIRDVTHQVCLHNEQEQPADDAANLKRIQIGLRRSIREAQQAEISPDERVMQDGMVYENGYRIQEVSGREQLATDRWSHRRKELSDEDNNNESNNEQNVPQNNSEDIDRVNYTEEQLAEMDGVKFRPIVRDDGSGRRKAFKKRQQSSSSTSSGEPNMRSSREDELKMFTSLEEEELRSTDYTPIQYSSDPKVSKKNHRRHKRSPGRDGVREISDEEGDPWGNLQPKHFHDHDLWKRERASSIVEEAEDDGHHPAKQSPQMNALSSGVDPQRCYSPVGHKNPRTMSFEDATDTQHNMAIDAIKRRQTSKHDVRSSRRSDNKGKNVSTDDDDDDDADTEIDDNDDASAPLAASHTEHTQSPSSPTNACAAPELGLSGRSSLSHSSLDEAKIGEYISYIETLDDLDRRDPEHVDFQEIADTSRRIRHTSYNTNATDHELEGIVVNKEDTVQLDRVNSQEQQLKLIKAQINKINSSMAPVTRELLSVDKMPVNINTFIQRESTPPATINTPSSQSELNINEEIQINETSPKKYITFENISLVGHSDESTPSLTPMTAASDAGIANTFEIRPNIQRMTSAGHSPLRSSSSFFRSDSFESAESSHFYRQQSSSSGVSAILEREAELEYIKGRDDWQDMSRSTHIADAIDSDNYHHRRRYSEIDDTLEYIRGRDDWKKRQGEQERSSDIMEIDDAFDLVSVGIRDQIDSDEYHHARRLSECLDLAYTSRSGRFMVQESARNGRSRSPFRVLRSDMDRKFDLDRHHLKGPDEFERAVSESRDIAEERMITNERLSWSKSSTRTQSSLSPAPIHILIEDTSIPSGENDVEYWEEVEVVEFPDEAPSTGNSRTSSGWDLEPSYDADDTTSAENTTDIVEPSKLNKLEERRRRAEAIVHQNTLTKEDTEADEEVAGILNVPNAIAMDSQTESSRSDLSGEEDDKSGSVSLKKSKTTRNLLLAERLSVDLSSNEEALRVIAAKSDEMKRTKFDATSSFLEQERKNENEKVTSITYNAVGQPTTSKLSDNPLKPVKITTMDEKSAAEQSRIQKRSNPTRTHENMDDLMLETSMGPWFHK